MREYKSKRSVNKEGVADSETLTNSTHSSLNENVDEDFTPNFLATDHGKSPLQNYFNNNVPVECSGTTVSFFDGCADATTTAPFYDRETATLEVMPTTVTSVDMTGENYQQEYITENVVSRYKS